jgi:hypothetical protein
MEHDISNTDSDQCSKHPFTASSNLTPYQGRKEEMMKDLALVLGCTVLEGASQ